jgi:hypothetical protein
LLLFAGWAYGDRLRMPVLVLAAFLWCACRHPASIRVHCSAYPARCRFSRCKRATVAPRVVVNPLGKSGVRVSLFASHDWPALACPHFKR